MSLAAYMMLATVAVFVIGAVFGLWWSIASGQWRHLEEGARIVLADDDNL